MPMLPTFNSRRYQIGVCIVFALLTGCGGQQSSMIAPVAAPQASATRAGTSNYSVVYSFSGGADGANPYAALADVRGTLYGTTLAGGTSSRCTQDESGYGCGTVFSVTLNGKEKVLHRFGAEGDGFYPRASLLYVRGTFYGTTAGGGSGGSYDCYSSYYGNCGTVFSIAPGGAETVLHSFGGFSDGGLPYAPLIDVNGTLYGTTTIGGQSDCAFGNGSCGTAFSITTAGAEKVLHFFRGGEDGAAPYAGLTDVGGTLYGTTAEGGDHGTVFSITTDGSEKVLHRFGGKDDGQAPFAGLLKVRGALYGTTEVGGDYGGGTVFSITMKGTEKVLHSFGYGADGAHPLAPLIDVNGTLYGTTFSGGANSCGTVFSITPNGTETVLYSFEDGTSNGGFRPQAGLVNVRGTLYGTASSGGAYGYGTVFSLKP
jgi:uncharacterized repeat protein (TIGR03803 family)